MLSLECLLEVWSGSVLICQGMLARVRHLSGHCLEEQVILGRNGVSVRIKGSLRLVHLLLGLPHPGQLIARNRQLVSIAGFQTHTV